MDALRDLVVRQKLAAASEILTCSKIKVAEEVEVYCVAVHFVAELGKFPFFPAKKR